MVLSSGVISSYLPLRAGCTSVSSIPQCSYVFYQADHSGGRNLCDRSAVFKRAGRPRADMAAKAATRHLFTNPREDIKSRLNCKCGDLRRN